MVEMMNVGVVGLGRWGRALADGAVRSGVIRIVSGYSRTASTRDEFAADYGCRPAASLTDLVANPEIEAVIVASTNSTHLQIIEAAAEAGKGVFVDKPLTLSAGDSRAAVAAAERAGTVLQVGYQRRKLPANRELHRLIVDGDLGSVLVLEAHHTSPNGHTMGLNAWRWDASESPLGSMTSLGVHSIDLLSYLGGRIERVSASARGEVLSRSIDDVTAMLFEFEGGAVGTLVSSFFTPVRSALAVHGTSASAFMDADGSQLSIQLIDSTDVRPVELAGADPLAEQMEEFARAVRGEVVPETAGHEGLVVDLVMQAAAESVRSGRWVDVPAVG